METPEYDGTSDARWRNSRGDFEGYDQDVVRRNSPVWSFFDLEEGNPLEPSSDLDEGNRPEPSESQEEGTEDAEIYRRSKFGGRPPIFDAEVETLGSLDDDEPIADGGYIVDDSSQTYE